MKAATEEEVDEMGGLTGPMGTIGCNFSFREEEGR
jgi:hypothetical protein